MRKPADKAIKEAQKHSWLGQRLALTRRIYRRRTGSGRQRQNPEMDPIHFQRNHGHPACGRCPERVQAAQLAKEQHGGHHSKPPDAGNVNKVNGGNTAANNSESPWN